MSSLEVNRTLTFYKFFFGFIIAEYGLWLMFVIECSLRTMWCVALISKHQVLSSFTGTLNTILLSDSYSLLINLSFPITILKFWHCNHSLSLLNVYYVQLIFIAYSCTMWLIISLWVMLWFVSNWLVAKSTLIFC